MLPLPGLLIMNERNMAQVDFQACQSSSLATWLSGHPTWSHLLFYCPPNCTHTHTLLTGNSFHFPQNVYISCPVFMPETRQLSS
jgi:hypothetical protein